ncbi:hypothetical protein EKH55_5704 (plasmid) [Sinorhizobium alkalisoli]|nr:hypothetical protein EKH55_5704 [Sinorhizobium alkalisoli]
MNINNDLAEVRANRARHAPLLRILDQINASYSEAGKFVYARMGCTFTSSKKGSSRLRCLA